MKIGAVTEWEALVIAGVGVLRPLIRCKGLLSTELGTGSSIESFLSMLHLEIINKYLIIEQKEKSNQHV